MHSQFVTFNFDSAVMENKPSLTTNALLAYCYTSREAAQKVVDQLNHHSDFPHTVEVEAYENDTRFRVRVYERQFEIAPCRLLDEHGSPVSEYDSPNGVEFERCEPDDFHLVCWSLYEIQEDGRREWMRDRPTKAEIEKDLDNAIEETRDKPDRYVGDLAGERRFKEQGITRNEGNGDEERPDPNDCAECARSFGPWYTGPCEH
jgi:hypothetical protein